MAVGDRVQFELEKTGDEVVGVITYIEDRINYIIRKSVKLSKQTHIIAANIDQVFLLITLRNPKTFTVFIDRFLATSEAYDVPAILLFNKIDIYEKEEKGRKMIKGFLRADLAMKLSQERHPAFNACRPSSELPLT